MVLTPGEVIRLVAQPLTGLPACIAGSAVAAEAYGIQLKDTSDIDVFCFTEQTLMTSIERLFNSGFTLDDRFARVRERWLLYGLRSWHTHSIKLETPSGFEVNLVYKLVGGNPVNSLAAVLSSFDFGLLAEGYDLLDGTYRDLRPFLFPGMSLTGPLPLLPDKARQWEGGFISQYNGLREAGRYAKYVSYGHDMSLVQDQLIPGYHKAIAYNRDRGGKERETLADIYENIVMKIDLNMVDELLEINKQILTLDSLDAIMDALE